MDNAPSARPCKLFDPQIQAAVTADILLDFPTGEIDAVERTWAPARELLGAAKDDAGKQLESGHWDWRIKIDPNSAGRHRLIAIQCESEIQGLMALTAEPKVTERGPVVYVDYIETAPWNQKLPGQLARFQGVGTVLIAEAVRISIDSGYDGRVGLHALPQAEAFYASRCRMSSYGPDPTYDKLVYFEFSEAIATEFLFSVGRS